MKTIAVLLLILFFGLPLLASHYLARRLEQSVHENCHECELSIGDLQISLIWAGRVVLHEVHFRAGRAEISLFESHADRIALRLALRALLHHELVIRSLEIEKPEVTFTDGEGQSPKTESSDSSWEFVLENLVVHDGKFHYIRNTHGTSATLNLHQIELVAKSLGTPLAYRERPTEVRTQAQIEKSGGIDLTVVTKPFAQPLPIDLDLVAHDQDLRDLTPFFKENAGVLLSGKLAHGHGVVKALGSHLTSTVRAEYKDLKVELVPMYDRNDLTAFFTNLGMKVAMKKKNENKPVQEQVRATELERGPKDSIVSFILTGLKVAALDVTMPELTPEPKHD